MIKITINYDLDEVIIESSIDLITSIVMKVKNPKEIEEVLNEVLNLIYATTNNFILQKQDEGRTYLIEEW